MELQRPRATWRARAQSGGQDIAHGESRGMLPPLGIPSHLCHAVSDIAVDGDDESGGHEVIAALAIGCVTHIHRHKAAEARYGHPVLLVVEGEAAYAAATNTSFTVPPQALAARLESHEVEVDDLDVAAEAPLSHDCRHWFPCRSHQAANRIS